LDQRTFSWKERMNQSGELLQAISLDHDSGDAALFLLHRYFKVFHTNVVNQGFLLCRGDLKHLALGPHPALRQGEPSFGIYQQVDGHEASGLGNDLDRKTQNSSQALGEKAQSSRLMNLRSTPSATSGEEVKGLDGHSQEHDT
jgi:hypothetical protein